jgi:hypothetical protein
MRTYDFYLLDGINEYGQENIGEEVAGQIKMAIFQTAQSTTNTVLYADADYLGLTHDAEVNDAYVINYNGERLKVRQINAQGRLRQVFLKRMG